jgi:hypothetical protein
VISTALLSDVNSELERLGAGSSPGLYLTIIESAADRAIGDHASENPDVYKFVLVELNSLLRSLKRSNLPASNLATKLSSLSEPASEFLTLEYGRKNHADADFDLSTLDWSDPILRDRLQTAVKQARKWVHQPPGSKTQTAIHAFCREVMLVYSQLTGKQPGVGGSSTTEDYQTPFERLWHTSLKLIQPNTTILQARESHRRASNRR